MIFTDLKDIAREVVVSRGWYCECSAHSGHGKTADQCSDCVHHVVLRLREACEMVLEKAVKAHCVRCDMGNEPVLEAGYGGREGIWRHTDLCGCDAQRIHFLKREYCD